MLHGFTTHVGPIKRSIVMGVPGVHGPQTSTGQSASVLHAISPFKLVPGVALDAGAPVDAVHRAEDPTGALSPGGAEVRSSHASAP
ncbi:hypothetical protein [Sorangium sp. So ce385]|uniref:hypothetical protein n=1 Tax=Sorangium sp. So ce385 TaxID=3133308 RepID=UPI003F5B479C